MKVVSFFFFNTQVLTTLFYNISFKIKFLSYFAGVVLFLHCDVQGYTKPYKKVLTTDGSDVSAVGAKNKKR